MKTASYEVLKIKDFRNFLSGRSFGIIAIQIQAVIVGWQVYEITRDPLSLGLVGLFEIIPSMSVALFAGHLADRVSRKKIIQIAISILTICSLLLFILSSGMISSFSGSAIPIYSVIVLSGFARGFLGASLSSFMAQLVPKNLYHNSAAWNSTAWQISAVTGPFVGGFLYSLGAKLSSSKISISYLQWVNGASLAYSVDLSLMLIALFFFSRVESKPLP
ncbi:MAG: MFS transporter, partial [Leptospiraceae bacterium]|nr:MFS transporter [Leptospiraceae bacterium]